MAGGGSTGTLDFPAHMEDVHHEWLGWTTAYGVTKQDTDISDLIKGAMRLNPGYDMTYYDPSLALDSHKIDLSVLKADIESMSPEGILAALSTSGTALSDNLLSIDFSTIEADTINKIASIPTDMVQAAVTALPEDMLNRVTDMLSRALAPARNKALHSVKASMSSNRALRTSTYHLAAMSAHNSYVSDISLQQSQLIQQLLSQGMQSFIEAFRSSLLGVLQLQVQQNSEHNRLMANIAAQIEQSKLAIAEMDMQSIRVLYESTEKEYLMKNEYRHKTSHRRADDYLFKMDMYQRGANILAAPAGAVGLVQQGNSKFQSAVSGFFSGAAAGATISPGNPWAAGIGGAIGAISGLVNN